jgi:hypothetical protein
VEALARKVQPSVIQNISSIDRNPDSGKDIETVMMTIADEHVEFVNLRTLGPGSPPFPGHLPFPVRARDASFPQSKNYYLHNYSKLTCLWCALGAMCLDGCPFKRFDNQFHVLQYQHKANRGLDKQSMVQHVFGGYRLSFVVTYAYTPGICGLESGHYSHANPSVGHLEGRSNPDVASN